MKKGDEIIYTYKSDPLEADEGQYNVGLALLQKFYRHSYLSIDRRAKTDTSNAFE